MKLVRVFNAAAFLLIGTLLLAACALTAAPTATPDGSFAPTGEATFTAKPTAASTVGAEGTPKPIEKLNVFVRRVELPEKTDGMLLPCYIMEQSGWGYANERGELPVAFLADCDITGGNSGSPVLNAKGALLGLAFDGNWEAMSGDVAFEPELQRTIAVDVRYVLFVIDKFAGAGWLLDELQFE